MNFLKNILRRKEERIDMNAEFWKWFQNNEKSFYSAVKNNKNIEEDFFDPLSEKLNKIKDGFYFLTGMYNDNTAELIFTPDGNIKNIIFVEELVATAPTISGWIFTALKPESDIKNVVINMANYRFDENTLFFYSNEIDNYPDEIDITIIHKDYNEADASAIINGTYIFLDNFLGELNSITTIDNLTVAGIKNAEKELIPIVKLKDFLIWRQKEFVEKYEGVLQNTDNANFSIFEAELKSGNKLIATINTDILNWDKKASHPWIVCLEIKFGGEESNGMPDNNTYQKLNEIEDIVHEELKDYDGYLNIGRQTADGVREVYFACKEFRKPSKVMHEFKLRNSERFVVSYSIYKDKYWKSFDRFRQN